MSEQTKKKFGVWMDTQHAIIVAATPPGNEFTVLGHAKNPAAEANSNENASNNREITMARKFFKEIGTFLVNAEEVHLTGTGTIQEQFKHYLAETPQFKKTVVTESTSNKMSDERLAEYIGKHFK